MSSQLFDVPTLASDDRGPFCLAVCIYRETSVKGHLQNPATSLTGYHCSAPFGTPHIDMRTFTPSEIGAHPYTGQDSSLWSQWCPCYRGFTVCVYTMHVYIWLHYLRCVDVCIYLGPLRMHKFVFCHFLYVIPTYGVLPYSILTVCYDFCRK